MKTPIAVLNNNPLNIRYNPMNDWIGQTGDRRGFCTFSELAFGCRAALKLLRSYVSRGYDTIPEIISRWAPASENNTKAYIGYVVDRFAFDLYDAPDAAAHDYVLGMRIGSRRSLVDLAVAMASVEIGRGWLSHNPEFEKRLVVCFDIAADYLKLC